jgi:hypothetical protein
MARARPRHPAPPDGEACWGWLLERLDPGHPEHRRGVWWAHTLVCTRPPPTDPAVNRAVVDGLFAVALDPDTEAWVTIRLAAALMEMSYGPMRAQAQARRLQRRMDREGRWCA